MASPHHQTAAYAGLGKPRPFIPVPSKRSVEFRFQEFLDEAANAGPHPGFQRIEPMVPKEKRSFGCITRRLYGILFHGVISVGALTPIQFEQTNWRLRHLQIPTTPATPPRLLWSFLKHLRRLRRVGWTVGLGVASALIRWRSRRVGWRRFTPVERLNKSGKLLTLYDKYV
jgi:hypothetical protein